MSGLNIADMLTFAPPLDEAAVLAAIEAKRPIIEHEVELFRKIYVDPAVHLQAIQALTGLVGKKG